MDHATRTAAVDIFLPTNRRRLFRQVCIARRQTFEIYLFPKYRSDMFLKWNNTKIKHLNSFVYFSSNTKIMYVKNELSQYTYLVQREQESNRAATTTIVLMSFLLIISSFQTKIKDSRDFSATFGKKRIEDWTLAAYAGLE